MAYICKKAKLEINMKPLEALRALNWNKFGTKQQIAMLGDVLTFVRKGGGRVGIYVGEDQQCYHILGGNQNNEVNITRIRKNRLSQIRRTAWKIKQPINIKQVFLNSNGIISINEQ